MKKFLTLFIVTLASTGCFDDSTPKDWSEVVTLYVDAEFGEYRPWGLPEDAPPLEGLKIREKEDAAWDIIALDGIEGFSYSVGCEYCLEVEKTHLAAPPADAPNIRYKLLRIIGERPIR